MKQMNWQECARSPLSTNIEGRGNGFERRGGVCSDLIAICCELSESQKRKRANESRSEWMTHCKRQLGWELVCLLVDKDRAEDKTSKCAQWHLRQLWVVASPTHPLLKYTERGFSELPRGRYISEIELKGKDHWELLGIPLGQTARSSKRQNKRGFIPTEHKTWFSHRI